MSESLASVDRTWGKRMPWCLTVDGTTGAARVSARLATVKVYVAGGGDGGTATADAM